MDATAQAPFVGPSLDAELVSAFKEVVALLAEQQEEIEELAALVHALAAALAEIPAEQVTVNAPRSAT